MAERRPRRTVVDVGIRQIRSRRRPDGHALKRGSDVGPLARRRILNGRHATLLDFQPNNLFHARSSRTTLHTLEAINCVPRIWFTTKCKDLVYDRVKACRAAQADVALTARKSSAVESWRRISMQSG